MRAMMRNEDGFTLTEVLVALFLLAAVSAVFLPLMESSLRVTVSFEQAARGNDAARLALAQLDREFRSAEEICDPDPGLTADRLDFKTRAYTATTTATGWQRVVYELRDPDGDGQATDLQRSVDGGAWRTVIANAVNATVVDDAYNAEEGRPPGTVGVPLVTVEGGSPTSLPSEAKVVTVRVWVDTFPNDQIGPKLATTELSGRNIWSPTRSTC